MAIEQRMMALGIRRMPRELRYIRATEQLQISLDNGESTSRAVQADEHLQISMDRGESSSQAVGAHEQLQISMDRGESSSQAVESIDNGQEVDLAVEIINAVEQVEGEQVFILKYFSYKSDCSYIIGNMHNLYGRYKHRAICGT
jgi:hypothetical protein